jgi:hypothetical protein
MKTINKKKSLSVMLLTTFALFLSMQFNVFAQTNPPNPFTPCEVFAPVLVYGAKTLLATPSSCTDCKIVGTGTPVYDGDGKLTGHNYNVETNPTVYSTDRTCTTVGAKATDQCRPSVLTGGQDGPCPKTVFISVGPGSGTGTGTGH